MHEGRQAEAGGSLRRGETDGGEVVGILKLRSPWVTLPSKTADLEAR